MQAQIPAICPAKSPRKPRKRLTKAERYQRHRARVKRLALAKDSISVESAEVFEDKWTRRRCREIIDVDLIPESTWDDWRKKALAKLDRKFLPVGVNSFATHIALITIACTVAENHRGPTPTRSKQIGTLALARTLESASGADIALWGGPKQLTPKVISLEELEKRIAEIVPVPSRSQKYKTKWRRKKKQYTKDEANEILKQLNHPQAR